jgi:hypothetical protein
VPISDKLQIPRSPTPASKCGWLGTPVARDDKFLKFFDKLLDLLQSLDIVDAGDLADSVHDFL